MRKLLQNFTGGLFILRFETKQYETLKKKWDLNYLLNKQKGMLDKAQNERKPSS
jgi:hypothetical protein